MLYDIPETLTHFLLAGPDCSSCVEEFEVVLDTPRSSTVHHEEAHSVHVMYRKDVLSFVETVEQFGNPSGSVMSLSHLTHKLLWSRKSSDLLVGSINLAKSIISCTDNQSSDHASNNGGNGSCLRWLANSFEEKRRWLIINSSPRGQCSK